MDVRRLKGILLDAAPDGELARSLTGRSPLVLPIANRPLAVYGLEAMAECGATEVAALVDANREDDVRTVGADAERLGLTLHTIEVPAATAPVDALLAARDFVGDDPALVHRADALVGSALAPLLDAFGQEEADVGLLVRASDDRIGEEGGALRLVSHPRIPAADDDLAPAFVLGPSALGHAAAAAAAGRAPATLVDLALALREAGGAVRVRTVHGSWRYRDDVDELLEGNRSVLDRLERDVRGADLSQARVEGRVAVHRSALVERTTIRGPATIAAGAVLVDAFVGPYSAIGENAHVEGAEVEHSIVLAGAAIRHVGRRLEASIIGREANVHRDFELPSALRVRVGRRAEVSLA
ncbi:MAG: glucose-phosphate thymidylyltransferase [Solirubrobacteraceae bacterium]|jgi:glucose-1-phosphate thymidylyltransferase|nr:glucose-phosphate thymidylyltransferase [Solirubrobacteraceae bacterium]